MLRRVDYDPPEEPDEAFFFSDGPYTPSLTITEHQQKGKKFWMGTAPASTLKSISYVPQIPEMDDYHSLADKMLNRIPGRWQRGLDEDRMPRLSEFWASQGNHIVNPLILGQRPQAGIAVSTIDEYEVLKVGGGGVNNNAIINLDNGTPLLNWALGVVSCGPYRIGGSIFNFYGEECGKILSFPTVHEIELDRPVTLAANAELRPNPWIRKLLSFDNWYVDSCQGCNSPFSDVLMRDYPAQFPDLAAVAAQFPTHGPYGDKCPCGWELEIPAGLGGLNISPQPIHVVDGQHRLEGTQRGSCANPPPAGGIPACDHSLSFTIMPDDSFNEALQKRIFMEITTEGVDLANLHKMLMYYLIGSQGTLDNLDQDTLGSEKKISVDLSLGTTDEEAYKLALSLVGTSVAIPDISPLSGLAPPFRGIPGRVRASDFGFLWAVIKGFTGPGGVISALPNFVAKRDAIVDYYRAIRGFKVAVPRGGAPIFQGWGATRSGTAPSGSEYWSARPYAIVPPANDYLGNPWVNNINEGIISRSAGGAVTRWQRILFSALFPDIFELASAILNPPSKEEYMRIMWGATGAPGAAYGAGLYCCNLEGAASLWETPNANQWAWQSDIMRDQLYRTQTVAGASAITDDLNTAVALANPVIAAAIAAGVPPSINDYMLLQPCLDDINFVPVDPRGPNGAQDYRLLPNTNLTFYMPLNCRQLRVEFYQNGPVLVGGQAVVNYIQPANRRMEYPRRNPSGAVVATWAGPQSGIQTIELRAGVNYIAGNGDLLIRIVASNDNSDTIVEKTVQV